MVAAAVVGSRTNVARAVLTAELGSKGSGNSSGGAVVVVVQGEEPSFSSSFLTRT